VTERSVPIDDVRGEDGVTVNFDLPGVSPDAVELEIEKNELRVSAERRSDLREGQSWIAHERPAGTFRRTIYLSDTLDAEAVEARWDNGVLAVHVPLAETAKPRKVSIAAAEDTAELES
jgi:HSP20 family protein